MSETKPRIRILGTRGVPAAHGGFETFAERLALHLVSQGWPTTVYCQREVEIGGSLFEDTWKGIERVTVEVGATGPKATLLFDWRSARHAAARDGLCLVLGYNGAAFLPLLRLHGRPVLANMDGIEWRRPKWGLAARGWFYANEWLAARSAHRLIADHPEIARHLTARYPGAEVVTIPYGADAVTRASPDPVRALGLEPGRYVLSVSRIEPDNNILGIVEAFCRRPRGLKLVVVGHVDAGTAYGRAIRAAANGDVVFPGPIYGGARLRSLRFHAMAYMHGHMAGGTNPSLVEALWAGNAVVAHDNRFNRGTAGRAALFFRDTDDCAAHLDALAAEPALLAELRRAARLQAETQFRWETVFAAYEQQFLALAALQPGALREPVLQPLKRRSV